MYNERKELQAGSSTSAVAAPLAAAAAQRMQNAPTSGDAAQGLGRERNKGSASNSSSSQSGAGFPAIKQKLKTF